MPLLVPFDASQPLYDVAATRRIELDAAQKLPAHTLMERAGLATARLALALAPRASTFWIACGPGNNGGDGLEAAALLKQWGLNPLVTWLGSENQAPGDALASLKRACDAGVRFSAGLPELQEHDLCVDALLGIGATRPPTGRMASALSHMSTSPAQVLSVDVPSGLNADTGTWHAPADSAANSSAGHGRSRWHTLSLLTLKPGLFTGQGRDACGTIWFDDLGVSSTGTPAAILNAAPGAVERPHASHKGTWGDVAIIGGECDAPKGIAMCGAALLAARAALHSGAGRVYVSLLGQGGPVLDAMAPELIFRDMAALEMGRLTVVCGCGGGDAVGSVLGTLLHSASRLVLDADALNAIARDAELQRALTGRATMQNSTVITPHPLEAARLLNQSTTAVQSDRLAAAGELSRRFQCTVVLKGSGTVVASPGEAPHINATGNGRLATAGTGDVLAGMIGARLAAAYSPMESACAAVWNHGRFADTWPSNVALTASQLCQSR